MGITAQSLQRLGLVDEIVPEPLGGAHRDPASTAKALKTSLVAALGQVSSMPTERLVERRHERLMRYGEFEEQ
jgi:acetyl-CoA carboxylase carboxyl transferase subunit alpha